MRCSPPCRCRRGCRWARSGWGRGVRATPLTSRCASWRSPTRHWRSGSPTPPPRGGEMERHTVDPEHPTDGALLAAAEVVLRGGVIAFPTDTLYALGCSLFDV